MAKERYQLDGRNWLSIAAAAKILRTNAQGIRRLIGEGKLDWHQPREGSSRFVVDEVAVLALQAALPPPRKTKLRRSPDPLRRPLVEPFPEPRGPAARGGGIFDAHRNRLTLPTDAFDEAIARRREREKKLDPGSSPG